MRHKPICIALAVKPRVDLAVTTSGRGGRTPVSSSSPHSFIADAGAGKACRWLWPEGVDRQVDG